MRQLKDIILITIVFIMALLGVLSVLILDGIPAMFDYTATSYRYITKYEDVDDDYSRVKRYIQLCAIVHIPITAFICFIVYTLFIK